VDCFLSSCPSVAVLAARDHVRGLVLFQGAFLNCLRHAPVTHWQDLQYLPTRILSANSLAFHAALLYYSC
jgi:hypothetical protein